jgi:hypothetical protein
MTNEREDTVASLFRLCMDSFRVAIGRIPEEQKSSLREEKYRLVLWKNDFDDLDRSSDWEKDGRLDKMVKLLLGSVANALNKSLLLSDNLRIGVMTAISSRR